MVSSGLLRCIFSSSYMKKFQRWEEININYLDQAHQQVSRSGLCGRSAQLVEDLCGVCDSGVYVQYTKWAAATELLTCYDIRMRDTFVGPMVSILQHQINMQGVDGTMTAVVRSVRAVAANVAFVCGRT
eukprot:GHVS01097345.1.p1 GENE.GHVS01097345.1~~GHVS01097345.1.p1  ORF type:complete len:129 (-),score=13.58 GHVS01097345.1:431-817(-)